jgi:hypothetical protein
MKWSQGEAYFVKVKELIHVWFCLFHCYMKSPHKSESIKFDQKATEPGNCEEGF